MLTASSIMEVDANATAAITVETVGDKKTDVVDDCQIAALSVQANELLARAIELEEQARHIETEDTSDEVAHARAQAASMRTTAENVSREISSAPTDRSGRKKIPATRVAAMSSAIEHVMHSAEKEKAAIEHADDAAKVLVAKKMANEAAGSEKKTTVVSVIRRVCGMDAPVAAASSIPMFAGVRTTLGSWREATLDYARETQTRVTSFGNNVWNSITATAQQSYDYVNESAPVKAVKEFSRKTAATITAIYYDPRKAAMHVVTMVSDTASDAADYVADTAKTAAEGARNAYTSAKLAVEEKMAAVKTSASRMMAGIFSSDDETKPVAKAKADPITVTAKSSMGKAISEAMALSLPLGITSLHVTDALHFSMPNLPKLNISIMQLPGLY